MRGFAYYDAKQDKNLENDDVKLDQASTDTAVEVVSKPDIVDTKLDEHVDN